MSGMKVRTLLQILLQVLKGNKVIFEQLYTNEFDNINEQNSLKNKITKFIIYKT